MQKTVYVIQKPISRFDLLTTNGDDHQIDPLPNYPILLLRSPGAPGTPRTELEGRRYVPMRIHKQLQQSVVSGHQSPVTSQ